MRWSRKPLCVLLAYREFESPPLRFSLGLSAIDTYKPSTYLAVCAPVLMRFRRFQAVPRPNAANPIGAANRRKLPSNTHKTAIQAKKKMRGAHQRISRPPHSTALPPLHGTLRLVDLGRWRSQGPSLGTRAPNARRSSRGPSRIRRTGAGLPVCSVGFTPNSITPDRRGVRC
jgi:hypothetical protein